MPDCIYVLFKLLKISKTMKRALLIPCCFIILMIDAAGINPDQIALIPKPKSVQTGEGVLNLKHVFRISDNSSPGHDYARFVNEIWMHGIDYKCINSSDAGSEIKIRYSGKADKSESYTLGIHKNGIEIIAQGNAGVLYAIETLACSRNGNASLYRPSLNKAQP